MMQEPETKRWTAKRKAELIKRIYRGQTTVPEAAREYDLTQADIEPWMEDAEAGMESVLKANPKDLAPPDQYERKLKISTKPTLRPCWRFCNRAVTQNYLQAHPNTIFQQYQCQSNSIPHFPITSSIRQTK